MNEARIYVSDYNSYNNGKLQGKWIELECKTVEEIQEEINEVLEENTKKLGSLCEEVMIQDYEGIPEKLYSESGIDLENIVLYLELNEDDKERYEYIISQGSYGNYDAFDYINDVLIFETKEDAIEDYISLYLSDIPEDKRNYLDDNYIWNTMECEGYDEENGQVFYWVN